MKQGDFWNKEYDLIQNYFAINDIFLYTNYFGSSLSLYRVGYTNVYLF